MITIPKIVHQIYFDLGLGKLEENRIFNESRLAFENLQGLDYKLWGEAECEDLIRAECPEYYDLYKNFKYRIQQIDFVRFAILYKYGGIYVDLDVLPLKNPLGLLADADFIGETLIFHNVRYVKPTFCYIENDFMVTVKNNNFWLELREYSKKQYLEKMKIEIYKIWEARFVLETTGPRMLSRFIRQKYPQVLPKKLVYTQWNEDSEDNYYLKDYKLNTWMKEKSRRKKKGSHTIMVHHS